MIFIFVMMLALFVIGIPIAWAMAISAGFFINFVLGIPLQSLPQRMMGGIDSFPLLAIPFFIFAGNLMNTGGITSRLVDFSKVLVGHITGGLGHVVVVSNMIMAGMSGSGIADAAGTGSVMIPAMKRVGYPQRFSSAIVAAASTIGPIIPPSIPFVIYGSMADVSIGRLLLAGALPGCLMGIILMIFVYIIAKKRNYPKEIRQPLKAVAKSAVSALPPLGMPLIILGGIVCGLMTPTESASVGAAYALMLGFFLYREINLNKLLEIIKETIIGTAAVTIIIAAASPIGWVLAFEQTPLKVLEFFQNAQFSQTMVLLIVNVALLILGCFLEALAIMVMAIPVLMPLIVKAGIDPVHFGVILTLNIMIGTITPPVGTVMYVVCALGKISIFDFAKEIWPFLIALVLSLAIITYVPEISLWLPNHLMPTVIIK
jgi:tripartite ATP-independent transporter DctM subunit